MVWLLSFRGQKPKPKAKAKSQTKHTLRLGFNPYLKIYVLIITNLMDNIYFLAMLNAILPETAKSPLNHGLMVI